MLVVSDKDYHTAIQSLESAGFREAPWSFFAREPEFYQGKGPMFRDNERKLAQEYRNLDQNSARFLFPADVATRAKVALLPSSYAHLDLDSLPEGSVERKGSILYPNAAILLQSMVQTLVREPSHSRWHSRLGFWAITHLYGDLLLDDDVLDSCGDEEAKAWFDENIQRHGGGLDRITHTKRLGRVGYDERLATQRDAPAPTKQVDISGLPQIRPQSSSQELDNA